MRVADQDGTLFFRGVIGVSDGDGQRVVETVAASAKEIPCLASLLAALLSSQTKSMGVPYPLTAQGFDASRRPNSRGEKKVNTAKREPTAFTSPAVTTYYVVQLSVFGFA